MVAIWTKRVALLSVVLSLAACATDKDSLLPHNGNTMLDVWDEESAGTAGPDRANRQLLDARLLLRRPLSEQTVIINNGAYTRTARNEIVSQFRRLPNPDLVMYIFPHLAGNNPVPIPGYSTVFPLYQRVEYALPGERVEDY
ncbi:TIGR03751 family conjugal transfer lipoprotein [Lelliottia amnigena]|uniref:TIGR03751 family conjugal transfer lipoprotein n=1 Tax=Lelliottia amnigena TaxID=61646 RepID=UPI0040578B14